jgi:hypothetical protein
MRGSIVNKDVSKMMRKTKQDKSENPQGKLNANIKLNANQFFLLKKGISEEIIFQQT